MFVEPSAYKSLEIEKIIDIIASRCRSELGSAFVRRAAPARDMDELFKRQELFDSFEKYISLKGDLPWNDRVASVEGLFEEAMETGLLTGPELLKIRMLMLLSMRIGESLNAARESFPSFVMLTRDIRDFTDDIAALSVIDEDGRLYDSASDKLRDIRTRMRTIRETIRRKGRAILNDPAISGMLQERVLTLRNGRHAFLVRQDAMGSFPGIVVDRSGSGSSVYMEPHSLIMLNNEHSSNESSERHEEQRILRSLTAKMLTRRKAVLDAQTVLGKVDLLYALSYKKRVDGWSMPELSRRSSFNLRQARHPLLFERAVPIDIGCGEGFRILVITGPNTGGKTVALKTAAVCVILGWMGFPIPAEEGSRVGDISEIFADIGDEQSIEQSLSTFSAHITHIAAILDRVTDRSFVLLDELGAGTDPDEGAALGIALLDWLRERKSLVLATTHHNPIKRFALSADLIETASVEFDISTLSPTYRILMGIPGRSNALLIAEKLGMPQAIIKRAESAMSGKEVSMEDLIGDLNEKRSALEREIEELAVLRKKLEGMKAEYEAKLSDIEMKREALIAEADKKALGIVRNAESSARALLKKMESADTKSYARRELEKKREHFANIEKSAVLREEKKILKKSLAAAPDTLKSGDSVRIIGTNRTASLLEVRGKKALIQAGAAEIEVPLSHLERVIRNEQPVSPSPVQIKVSRPTGVPSSIMVRGMTVDEALPLVEQYLDRAYRAGYESVAVIHGRGEGILRREVQELCKRIPYVAEHNLGGPGEGGYGVTIVRFRR